MSFSWLLTDLLFLKIAVPEFHEFNYIDRMDSVHSTELHWTPLHCTELNWAPLYCLISSESHSLYFFLHLTHCALLLGLLFSFYSPKVGEWFLNDSVKYSWFWHFLPLNYITVFMIKSIYWWHVSIPAGWIKVMSVHLDHVVPKILWRWYLCQNSHVTRLKFLYSTAAVLFDI